MGILDYIARAMMQEPVYNRPGYSRTEHVIQTPNGRLKVERTPSLGLRIVRGLKINGQPVVAIEQNPNKPSASAKLAQTGHKVVQFKVDSPGGGYIGRAVDGVFEPYPSSHPTGASPNPIHPKR